VGSGVEEGAKKIRFRSLEPELCAGKNAFPVRLEFRSSRGRYDVAEKRISERDHGAEARGDFTGLTRPWRAALPPQRRAALARWKRTL